MQALSIVSAILSADNSQTQPAEEREISSAIFDPGVTMHGTAYEKASKIPIGMPS